MTPDGIAVDWNSLIAWMARQLGTILVLLGLARTAFQPWLDNYILGAVKRKRDEFKVWLIADIHTARFREYDDAVERTRSNEQRLEAMFASLTAHGSELARMRERVDEMPRMADALDRIDAAIEQLARTSSETRDMVLRIQGAWDGRERRHDS